MMALSPDFYLVSEREFTKEWLVTFREFMDPESEVSLCPILILGILAASYSFLQVFVIF